MSQNPAAEHARQEPHTGEEKHRRWLGLIVVLGVGAVLLLGFTGLPGAGAALPAIARRAVHVALPAWGQTEVVSELVYGTRGFDTFGETFLLLAAVFSVLTLSRGREPRSEYLGEATAGRSAPAADGAGSGDGSGDGTARRAEQDEADDGSDMPYSADDDPLGTPAPERAVAMSVVVRFAARIAAVVLLVAAVYLAAWGYTPGGGFPAGAAVAGVVILLYAAFGHRGVRAAVRPPVLEPIELVGAAGIVAIGLLSLYFRGSMFANFLTLAEPATIRAGGTNQLYSGSELIEVGSGLIIAVFSLLGMGHDWTEDEDDRQ